MTEKIPGPLLKKVSLLKYAFILEYKIQIARVVDDDARREGRDRDVEGFIAKEPLAAGKPCKEALTRLQEENPVPYNRECVGRFPSKMVSLTLIEARGNIE
jgi:hypothetical protein